MTLSEAVILLTKMEEDYAIKQDWDHLQKTSFVKAQIIAELTKKRKWTPKK